MRKWRLIGLLGILGVGALLQGAPPSSARLTFFFSGYVQGNFEPCGCKVNPSGGLARRAGAVEAYRQKHEEVILQVDVGNYFKPLGPEAELINPLMLESLSLLPIHVLNLAPEDLYLWPRLAQAGLNTQIISTNLTPRQEGVPAPSRRAVLELPAESLRLPKPLRIGFLGLVDPSRVKPNSGFTAQDPLEAVAREGKELFSETDWVVVLADLDHETARLLARRFPQIQVILLGERRYLLHPPEEVGQAVILASVERGRYLGRLTLELDPQGRILSFEPDFIELGSKVAEDPRWLEKQNQLARHLP